MVCVYSFCDFRVSCSAICCVQRLARRRELRRGASVRRRLAISRCSKEELGAILLTLGAFTTAALSHSSHVLDSKVEASILRFFGSLSSLRTSCQLLEEDLLLQRKPSNVQSESQQAVLPALC